MLLGWLWAGYGLALSYRSAIYELAMGQLWAGYQLAIGWQLAIYWLPIGYLSAGYWLAIRWLLAGNCQAINWQSDGYWLAITYLLADHGLTISWLFISWLCPQINILQDSHIPLCTKVAHGCYQYFGLWCLHTIFWQSAGYWLASYVPKSIHFKT